MELGDSDQKKAAPPTDMNPWRGAAPCGDGFGFIFQLSGGAVGVRDVVPLAEVNGLVDGAAFPIGVEVADFDDGAGVGDVMVGWDGDVAGGNQLVAIV